MADWCCIVAAMSFNITVTVADGEPTVAVSGDVKDGKYAVSGHEDRSQVYLGITQSDSDDRPIVSVHGTRYREV